MLKLYVNHVLHLIPILSPFLFIPSLYSFFKFVGFFIYLFKIHLLLLDVVNPRCACTAKVTVLALCVCVCVCVCVSVCLSPLILVLQAPN